MKLNLMIFAILASAGVANAADVIGMAEPWQLGFQEPASPVKEQLYDVHDFLLIIITAITLFVMGLLIWVAVRYNQNKNPNPSKTTHNTLIEIIWTAVPVIILIAIAIPSLRLHYYMAETPEPDLTIKAVGYQWYWNYTYPDHDNLTFDSYMIKDEDIKEGQVRLLSVDNPIYVPVNKVVRLHITGGDVLHAFALPAFGVKKDAIPGRLNETWFKATKEGTFYGQCSELCGVGHGFMPIEIRVVSDVKFRQWLASAKRQFSNNTQMKLAEIK